jgi:ribonuclease-3
MQELKKIEHLCGYQFKNKKLLETALTHSSYAYQMNIESYERLEFLGDAVINFAVAVEIFKKNPDKDEQYLTNLKSAYVNRNFLYRIGENLELKDAVRKIGFIEPRLDQVVEALVGAIYLDGGFNKAKRFIKRFILSEPVSPLLDYKGLAETTAHEKFGKSVKYKLEKEYGPAHNKMFLISARIPGKNLIARAKGKTKKEAEIKAAKILLQKMEKI